MDLVLECAWKKKKTDKAYKGSRIALVPPEERDKSQSPGNVGPVGQKKSVERKGTKGPRWNMGVRRVEIMVFLFLLECSGYLHHFLGIISGHTT